MSYFPKSFFPPEVSVFHGWWLWNSHCTAKQGLWVIHYCRILKTEVIMFVLNFVVITEENTVSTAFRIEWFVVPVVHYVMLWLSAAGAAGDLHLLRCLCDKHGFWWISWSLDWCAVAVTGSVTFWSWPSSTVRQMSIFCFNPWGLWALFLCWRRRDGKWEERGWIRSRWLCQCHMASLLAHVDGVSWCDIGHCRGF